MYHLHLITFRSLPRKTPFAPEWFYQVAYDQITNVDFEKISYIVLENEKKILEKFPPAAKGNVDGYTGLGDKSLTSRYDHYNLFEWPEEEIQKLEKSVWETHRLFLQQLEITYDHPLRLKGWANVLRKGECINPHMHNVTPDSYLTGHITIQSDDTSTYYINPVNQINDPEFAEVENVVGRIVLLPACMPHYTDVHEGDKERITIAFDFIPTEDMFSL